ncbi:Deaminated glutathione amidase [Acropora cervicornis]|uniref:Deaminated glutathione amidase n=1 Tax=Acropora cervicornis TaxID=6130 RepID=A0AAD9QR63_ACRCE|nr:Deaminated glutathione amidase [Acropora cervicornis]
MCHFKQNLGTARMEDSDQSGTVVAVCQMNSTIEVERNLEICEDLIRKAKTRGAKMVFLPECFDYVAESSEQACSMAAPLQSPRMQCMCALAQELGVWLSLGGYHEQGPPGEKRLYNSHVIVNDSGVIVEVYHKMHLFDVNVQDGPRLKESNAVIPGDKIVPPVPTPVGNVLLRSRAIENQCYVIAAAQTGQHNAKRRSYGHAMIVDPWGCVIAQCGEGNDLSVAEIDLAYLNKVRQQMPIMNHKRKDLYGKLNSCPKL